MNREIRLDQTPKRIVSLVPSQTELLHALGLVNEVVGITKFCVHPDDWYRNKTRIGGTKKVNFEKIHALNPDLIIGNKEENERSDIDRLEHEYPVWMSDIFNLEDAFEMIRSIGDLTGTSDKSNELIRRIQKEFEDLDAWVAKQVNEEVSVAYFIWKDPDYCAGTNTFIDAMLKRCGLKNYLQEERYPEFKAGTSSPDLIFLSSEPFPFKEKHIQEFQEMHPKAKVVLVDGEMFSWYGSRLEMAPAYFKRLLKQLTSN